MDYANFSMFLAAIPTVDTKEKTDDEQEVIISPENELSELQKDIE